MILLYDTYAATIWRSMGEDEYTPDRIGKIRGIRKCVGQERNGTCSVTTKPKGFPVDKNKKQ